MAFAIMAALAPGSVLPKKISLIAVIADPNNENSLSRGVKRFAYFKVKIYF